jgi:shikimate kinase
MILKLKRTPGIYVVGFMGAGKSTVGRHLAHRLGWSFFDTDSEIEAAEQTTIPELFSGRGEAEFRRIEANILLQHVRWIERGRPAVLALGGGTFAIPENRELLANSGLSIWLDCPFDIVQRRVAQTTHRPLARDPHAFAALFHARRDAYTLADLRVPVDTDDPELTVAAILAHPTLKWSAPVRHP